MFFKMFPYTSYRFGDADELSFTEDLTVYAEVLDTLRVNDSFYVDYYIQHGERADHVAYKLYNNPQLHWTFYLMNPDLRECGWPRTDIQVLDQVKKDLPHTVVNTNQNMLDKMFVGQLVTGQTSGASGRVLSRDVNLGQLVIEVYEGTFASSGEDITSVVGESEEIQTLTAYSIEPQYLSTKYHTYNGEQVDIDPYTGKHTTIDNEVVTPAQVSHYDYYRTTNNELRRIRALKESAVGDVVKAFRDAIG